MSSSYRIAVYVHMFRSYKIVARWHLRLHRECMARLRHQIWRSLQRKECPTIRTIFGILDPILWRCELATVLNWQPYSKKLYISILTACKTLHFGQIKSIPFVYPISLVVLSTTGPLMRTDFELRNQWGGIFLKAGQYSSFEASVDEGPVARYPKIC